MAFDPQQAIIKLLAQAEGTTNQDEAAAYSAKAQHLASTYAVDMELVRFQQESKEQREELTSKRIQVGEPGRQFKNRWWVDLFGEVAHVNDLEWTVTHDRAWVNVYGYPSDIRMTELLFTSLNTQMVSQCAAALRRGDHRAVGVHGATYRLNFYEAFIATLGVRLRVARRDALAERRQRDEEAGARLRYGQCDGTCTADCGHCKGGGVPATAALVMVKKKERVGDYYKAHRGVVSRTPYRSIRPKTLSTAAQRHGRDAAERATLGAKAALPGPRRTLPS